MEAPSGKLHLILYHLSSLFTFHLFLNLSFCRSNFDDLSFYSKAGVVQRYKDEEEGLASIESVSLFHANPLRIRGLPSNDPISSSLQITSECTSCYCLLS
ncbi:hypothetical protein LINGRAPRIM_LOCUS1891, partial [Linum grandiflorum]